MEGRWSAIRREPFRVFFPAAVVAGCVGVGHWLAYAAGLASSYSGSFHAAMQVGVYLGGFVAGFLMTAIPNFTGAPAASSAELLAVAALLAAQVVALALEQWAAAHAAFAVLLLFLALFVVRRARRRERRAVPPVEFIWVPLAFAFGVAGAALVAAGHLDLVGGRALQLGRAMEIQGFVLALVLGIGGFLVPRLAGRIDGRVNLQPVPPARAAEIKRRRLRALAAAAALLAASFPLEALGRIRAAYVLRATSVTLEYATSGVLLQIPRGRGFRGALLWSSLWAILAGLWGPAIAPAYRVALLHLMFLGGFSVMTFAVGAIVTLSHAAPSGALHRRQWVFGWVAGSIALAILARVPADRVPDLYFIHLGSAAACWLAGAVGWLAWSLPFLLRRAEPGAFEARHEEAKRRAVESGTRRFA